MKITIEIDIDIVDKFDNPDTIARIYYPHEGNKIQIRKGMNAITVSRAIHHELGHLFDYYLGQSKDRDVREKNAAVIGEGLRSR